VAGGALVLSHSQPRFFDDSHMRILQILAGTIAHLRLLAAAGPPTPVTVPDEHEAERSRESDDFAVVIFGVERLDAFGRHVPLDRERVRSLRNALRRSLGLHENVILHGPGELLALLPGTPAAVLPERVRGLRAAFEAWRATSGEALAGARLNVGFAACEEGDDLGRTLEVAALIMHPELEPDPGAATEIAAGS
jgi:hypothetical protein